MQLFVFNLPKPRLVLVSPYAGLELGILPSSSAPLFWFRLNCITGFLTVVFCFLLLWYRNHDPKLKVGICSRSWSRPCDRTLLHVLLSLLSHTTHITCLGVAGLAPATVGWVLHINHQSKECHTDMPTGQSYRGIFLNQGFLFPDDHDLCQADKNLTSTLRLQMVLYGLRSLHNHMYYFSQWICIYKHEDLWE